MRVIRDIARLPAGLRGAALAIGNFDGLHLGHRAVLEAMRERAEQSGIPPAVMSFEPHPRMFLTPGHAPHRIEPLHTKLRRLRAAGVETVYLLRFNAALSGMKAEDFVKEILEKRLNVAQVVTGEDFVFGHRRGGDGELLRHAAAEGRFCYLSVAPIRMNGEPCSSSRIRAHLAAAEMSAAAALLGRAHEITGRVRHGAARGRDLGVPTANLVPGALFLPKFGVYAVRYTQAAAEDWRDGVANLGVRPSFGGTVPVLEVHGFSEDRDLYGTCLRVQLLAFLREERKFSSPEALKRQIAQDMTHAREALPRC